MLAGLTPFVALDWQQQHMVSAIARSRKRVETSHSERLHFQGPAVPKQTPFCEITAHVARGKNSSSA